MAHLIYPQVRPGPKFCKSVKVMVTLVDTAKCIVFHIATNRLIYNEDIHENRLINIEDIHEKGRFILRTYMK